MIERLLETLFRYKLLILMPPLLIPLIVAPIAWLTAPSYYQAITGMWVERPTYLAYRDDSNVYMTPAQNQNAALLEMLRTRSFAVDVASRTDLAPMLAVPYGEQVAHEIVARSVRSIASGNHLLLLTARTSSPDLAYQLVTSVADAFKDRATSDRVSQAELAISFYESRLNASGQELTKANEAVRRYIAANPRLAAIDVGSTSSGTSSSRSSLATAAADPQLGQLVRQTDFQQREVDSIRSALERARLDISASLHGQELGFQVVDPAEVPSAPIVERRRTLLFPAAGALAGVILSSAILVLLLATDRSARSETDLVVTGRVLGSIPDLRLQGPGGLRASDGARRAIGFVAGTALPAPQARG